MCCAAKGSLHITKLINVKSMFRFIYVLIPVADHFMAAMVLLFTYFILTFTLNAQASSKSSRTCRCITGSSCFPGSDVWTDFNTSVSGSLLRVDPPAYPCYTPDDATECVQARTNWNNSLWRADQVGAAQNTNWESHEALNCPLPRPDERLSRSLCHQGDVPVYAVNASRAEQVQAAVRFAEQHRLRLVVKNTGHDYNGRSSARGALSIWTHSMKNITFHESFQAYGCDAGGPGRPAVEVGAGVQWSELYTAAHAQRRVLVGALSASVGAAGGYVLGGGHSPLSPTYGLAADNVLQFEIVSPDGSFRVVNRCVNQDLFWALRGGGGSTFGVVTTVVYETHPAVENVLSVIQVILANSSSSYRGLMSEFTRLHPEMSGQWAGYFMMSGRMLVMRYLAINRTSGYVEEGGMREFQRYVRQRPGELQVLSNSITSHASFLSWYQHEMCGFYATNNCTDQVGRARALGTRLIPSSVMQKNYTQVADALVNLLRDNNTDNRILGIFVGGGNAAVGRDNAVNPAWREALWHITAEKTWADNLRVRQVRARMAGISAALGPLRSLTPSSGVYFNEADYYEPDWQESLFGDRYTRLVELKRLYDPEGLFVCWHCVGSEEWSDDLNCLVNSEHHEASQT